MNFLHESVDKSYTKMKTWKDSKNGSYLDERNRHCASQLFRSEFAKVTDAPDDQVRKGSSHTKVFRVIPTENRIHPTHGRPLIKPEDMNIWVQNGKIHTFAKRHDYNKGFVVSS
jgi:hypothetical protein